MPFALILIGLALVISAIRGTHGDLAKLLKNTFTGEGNFLIWIIVIGVLGLIGYNQKGQTFSRYAMALVLLAMVLANGGVFEKFMSAISDMQDGGTSGAGSAGNTLPDGAATGSGGGGYSAGSPEVQAIGRNLDKIGAVGANVVNTVSSVGNLVSGASKLLKSVPILGAFF